MVLASKHLHNLLAHPSCVANTLALLFPVNYMGGISAQDPHGCCDRQPWKFKYALMCPWHTFPT